MNIDIDYKNNIFEIPELMKIYGEPSTDMLLDLRNEIHCNAQSVTTNLGGGQYEHLGLVMSDDLYTSLPNAEVYVQPVYPGPFTISSAQAKDAEIAQEKVDWEEDMRVWREVEAVERALV